MENIQWVCLACGAYVPEEYTQCLEWRRAHNCYTSPFEMKVNPSFLRMQFKLKEGPHEVTAGFTVHCAISSIEIMADALKTV